MHEREHIADIVEESVARVSNTVPQPRKKDMSVNSFVTEQKLKKEALDQLMAEQNARLASLNSPLPNLIKKTPKVTSSQPKRPYVPPPFPPKSVPAQSPGPAPGLSIAELTMNRSTSTQSSPGVSTPLPTPTTRSPGPAPGLSIAELTMNRSSTQSPTRSNTPLPTPATRSPGPAPGLSIAELTMNRTSKPNPAASIPAPPSSAPSPRLSLAEMTMLKKPSSSGKVAPKPAPVRQRAVRQPIPNAEEDEEDDDFSAYARGGDNKNLSIKDIMAQQEKQEGKAKPVVNNKSAKDKSKMWGIDMDRFNF